MSGDWERPGPKLGDGSDGKIEYSKKRNLHGWSIEEWINAIERAPDRSLPNGVGGALVAYYKSMLPGVQAAQCALERGDTVKAYEYLIAIEDTLDGPNAG